MSGIPAGRLSIEIVAEIARLQADLDKAKRAVKAASGDIAASAKAANDNLGGMSKGMAATAPSAKMAAFGMRNLAFQAQDLGVQLTAAAGSSDPLKMAFMAFVQQGPQIRDAFKQTGQSVGELAIGFARAHPLLLLLVAAVGFAVGAFKLFAAEIDRSGELDAYAKSLGLTKDELEKLGDVGLTAGDVFHGLWRTLDQGFGAGKVFSAIKQWAVDAFKTALNWANNFAAAAWAQFAGTGKALVSLAQAAKQALSGDFSGALATIKAIPQGYAESFAEAKKSMSGFFADWRQNSIDAAKNRISSQATKLIDDRAEAKLKKEAKEKGTLLGEILAGNFLARFSLELDKHPLITAKDIFGDDPLREQREAMKEKEEAEQRIRDANEYMDRYSRDRALKAAYEIADIIGGGVGGAIKDLADALDKAFPEFTKTIGEAIGSISSELGAAFKTMAAGAKIGDATDGIMKGLGIKSSNTGAQIGGALGSYFGPIGAIAGSILGGVVGGMLKKVKKASATIEIIGGEAVQTSLTGNSAKLKKVAGAMADSLIGGLSGIADQLGGLLGGAVKISIGQRNKTFRVDTSGMGRTKGMPKFETEQEAVQYALQQAILQGAITGLRAGTSALIKGEGDLEAQLQKALSFENVFKDLANRANPTIASLDAIAKEFEKLADIFDEAGASAADYADLQKLMVIRQREVIEAAFEPIRTMLDDLKSKAQSAGDAVKSAFQTVLDRETAAREAYNAALQRQAQARIATIKAEVDLFRDAAKQLRDFSASIFDGVLAPNLAALRAQFSAVAAKARGGNADAMAALPGLGDDLRQATMAGATDRISMLRDLARIKAEADKAAVVAEKKASVADQQLGVAQKQLEKLTGVEQTVAQARAELQSATAAADQARQQMAKLGELTEVELSFADAVAAYEAAKVDRDTLIREITQAGFAGMIEAQKQTGAQLVAGLSEAQARAAQAQSAMAAAIADAQAARAAAEAQRVANDNMPWLHGNYFPGFASGGDHAGGLRIVGENGPELEATGPSRIFNADQIASAIGGGNAGEIGAAVAAHLKPIIYPMVKAMVKMEARTDKWDGDGLPEERNVA